ncbi:MAG: DNA primase [Chloroflexi bacterium]|nr:DNA primase [Chloroflexota bacterium]
MTVIDEIKNRLDIVEVIGAYVKLTRSGRSYKGNSPFQNERTPSFFVFPETQTFKDFSSGEQGDVFSFIMKKEGWTFGEALRELAQRAGVQLEERTPEQRYAQDVETRLREACAAAAEYFHQLLKSAPQAAACRDYVMQKRRLTAATVDQWRLGFSLNDYHALTTHLTGRGFSEPELVTAGLVIENDEGRRYDRFRGRLMIPICDAKGVVVGFGSRSLDGSEPKYMNSPQTPIFDKGRLLFGLDRARNTMRNEQVAVLVEGYMDVIGTHQAGFTNVAAGMGTSLTEDQFRMLKRLSNRLVLALDADAAGDRAVLRGVDVARDALEREDQMVFDARGVIRSEARLSADIRVAVLPDGRDPDEIVLDAPDDWRAAIAGARPVVEHVMDVMLARFDLKDAKGRSEAVRAVAPVLLDLSDAVQRDFYVQFLSRRLQTNARAVAELLAEVGRQTPRSERRRSALVPGKGAPPLADDADGPPSPDLWGMEDGASIEPQRRPARMQPPQRGVDLEVHLVALIWRKPDLVRDANVALTRAELDTLVEADFANPVLRMAFRQISRMVMGQSSQSSDEDDEWLSIIAEHDMLPRIVDDEVLLREECVRTALSLRERNLKREKAGVAAAIDAVIDAATNNQNSDGMARYNIELIMEFGRVLQHELRVQKALQLRSGIHAT